ncbi:hypothetical protein [Ponticoccus litoralis]|uniref:Sporulation protein n=1 Tax=Ponticoccus litoralis TaxID=422297 RepID=A0AAW9S7P4_9RHOB
MDLKEFIVDAISSISEAVKVSDAAISDLGGLVNPGGHIQGVTGTTSGRFVAPRTTLDFDIAVSASKEGSAGGSAKAKIFVVEASVGGDAKLRSETVSRLTFSIDVVLPHDPMQADRIGAVKAK